jgi:hypothetical protein
MFAAAPCSQIPPIGLFQLGSTIKFDIHTKQKTEVYFHTFQCFRTAEEKTQDCELY